MFGNAAWARAILSCVVVWAMLPAPAAAASKALRNAGSAITIALPVAAVGVSLLHDDDWKGIGEFAVSAGLSVGTAYLFREIVRERRPDHSDFHTFTPPDVALSDASADYLWSRYGWRYGLPAYLGRAVVSYALTDSKKNHWYDTFASGAIAFGFNYAIVDRYHATGFHVSAEPQPHGAMLRFAILF